MLSSILISALAAASSVQAAPFFSSSKAPLAARQNAEPAVADTDKYKHTNMTDVQIHESCDAGQAHYIRNGLNDMKTLAQHAFDRIMMYGEEDEMYTRYFGNASSAAAAGFYAQMLMGNKPGVLFRCDNPDGNCNEKTEAEGPWAGHYRGKNATSETVICPPTYTNRMQLANLCWDGHQIGSMPPTKWLATDFLHRLTHVPAITNNHIQHAADSLGGVLELAKTDPAETVLNQNTFQFYALEAYAHDIAAPGRSCVVENPPIEEDDSHGYAAPAASSSGAASASATASAAAAATPSATESHDDHDHDDHDHEESSAVATPSPTPTSAEAQQVASATTTAEETCHTHADGVEHCF